VIDPIEELLQVHIDHHSVALLHVALCLKHRLVRSAPRTETVAVGREGRIDQGLQDLQQGLLDQPIHHRRNPQLPHPAARLGDLHAPHRRRPVAAIQYHFPNPGPVRLQVLRRLGDRASIHPSTTAIGLDPFPGPRQVRARQRLREQVASP
jgi:hypothetical protein